MTSLLSSVNTGFGLRRNSTVDVPSTSPPNPMAHRGSNASLLYPINPAYSDCAPGGGILINKGRPPSECSVQSQNQSDAAFSPTEMNKTPELIHARTSDAESSPPLSPHPQLTQSFDSSAVKGINSSSSSSSSKIRFAPLPTAPRHRSLSAGDKISEPPCDTTNWYGTTDLDVDEDVAAETDMPVIAEDEEVTTSTRRSSSGLGGKTMGMTKKLLKPFSSSDEKTNPQLDEMGGPLKKSISTGGLMGKSPFRSTHEQERKSSFLSTLSGQSAIGSGGGKDVPAKGHHRAGSTSDKPDFSSLSSSLGRSFDGEFAINKTNSNPSRPVKMLNGRVYGANRGDKAKKQKEPEFVEWGGMVGNKQSGAASGDSRDNGTSSTRAKDDDDDDGSGMGWVKRRREQRERERRASELDGGGGGGDAAAASRDSSTVINPRPVVGSAPMPPTKWMDPFAAGQRVAEPIAEEEDPRGAGHDTMAVNVPSHRQVGFAPTRERGSLGSEQDEGAVEFESDGDDDDDLDMEGIDSHR